MIAPAPSTLSPTVRLPLRVERKLAYKAGGAVIYLFVAPILGIVLFLIIWVPLGLLLDHWKLPPRAIGWLGVVLLVFTVAVACRWSWREFRRRARQAIVIATDAISLDLDRLQVRIPVESIHGVRQRAGLTSIACELLVADDRRVRRLSVPSQFATFDELAGGLQAALLGPLWHRFQTQLDRGEIRIVGDYAVIALTRCVVGAMLAAVGSAIYIVGLASFFYAAIRYAGIALVRHGWQLARAGWYGRQGQVIVERDGLRRGRRSELVPWCELVECQYNRPGLLLRGRQGERFGISRLGRDYWPAAPWIAEQVESAGSRERIDIG